MQLSDAANINKIINDKDYLSVVLISTVILSVITGTSKWTTGASGLFILCRGWFMYRKDRHEKKQSDEICISVISYYKQSNTSFAWVSISKQYLREMYPGLDDSIIVKCWEKLIDDGYVFFYEETKEYMFNKSMS